MPVQSWGHSQYWQGDGGGAPPAAGESSPGYAAWQSAVARAYFGSMFGALQSYIDAAMMWWRRR